jgi:hypothetical protein
MHSGELIYTYPMFMIEKKSDSLTSAHTYVAVLINNDALFIVNGNDGGTIPTSTPIVLNISNPDSITLMETYTDPNALLITAGPKLSAGAIAGIVIGACAFVSLQTFLAEIHTSKLTSAIRLSSLLPFSLSVYVEGELVEENSNKKSLNSKRPQLRTINYLQKR